MIEVEKINKWMKACHTSDVPQSSGACVLLEGEQIAIFNFTATDKWYATQNLCPHKMQMALSRGMIGDLNSEPKVACPFHKKNFSLATGECLTGEDYKIKTYEVKVENDLVYVLV